MSAIAPARQGLAIAPAPRADRWVATCWYLLFCNAAGFQGASVLPIPGMALQLVQWGSLLLALGIAVAHNPRLQVRPNALLTLMSLLVLAAAPGSLGSEKMVDSVLRLGAYAIFIAVLWLLSPAMGDGLRFVPYHLRFLFAMLLVVLLGLLVAPGPAMPPVNGGRLQGVLWPVLTTAVAGYAGVVVGLTTVLAINRMVGRWTATLLLGVGMVTLLLTQTRTSLAGLVLGLAMAAAGQASVNARARRFIAWSAGLSTVAALTLMPVVVGYLQRGQGDDWLTKLSGRTMTWEGLLAEERGPFEQWFGEGLGATALSARAVDSTWLGAYHRQGMVGLVIVAIVFATPLVCALLRPPSVGRSCALFLITYCAVATYSTSTLGDGSPWLMHLFVATAALMGADAAGSAAPAFAFPRSSGFGRGRGHR